MVDTTFFKNKGPFTLEQIAQITGAKLKDETKKDKHSHIMGIVGGLTAGVIIIRCKQIIIMH